MADKKSKITPENLREAAKLKALWEAAPSKKTQAVFGEHYGLGNQANVGHYLNGRSALNPKAAKAFAEELKCEVADFSVRVAKDLAALGVEGASTEDFLKVRHAAVSFSNGHGHVVFHEEERPPLSFRVEFLRKLGIRNGDAVVVDADGDSNEPKIPDGSVVLVDRGDTERLDGGFFYAYRAGTAGGHPSLPPW